MTYETQRDRNAELEAAFSVAQSIDCEYLTTPTMADVDLLFFRGMRLLAVGEVKSRTQQYDTVWLEVAKYDKLVAVAESMRVRMLFIVSFSSGVYYVDPAKLMPMEIGQGLRTDRPGETPDDCYMVPVDKMEVVNG